jgi:hypothetical protein
MTARGVLAAEIGVQVLYRVSSTVGRLMTYGEMEGTYSKTITQSKADTAMLL